MDQIIARMFAKSCGCWVSHFVAVVSVNYGNSLEGTEKFDLVAVLCPFDHSDFDLWIVADWRQHEDLWQKRTERSCSVILKVFMLCDLEILKIRSSAATVRDDSKGSFLHMYQSTSLSTRFRGHHSPCHFLYYPSHFLYLPSSCVCEGRHVWSHRWSGRSGLGRLAEQAVTNTTSLKANCEWNQKSTQCGSKMFTGC